MDHVKIELTRRKNNRIENILPGLLHKCYTMTMTTPLENNNNPRQTHVDSLFHTIMECKVTLSSPCLHPIFGPSFILHPLFLQWYLQSKDIFKANLSMKNVDTQHLMHKVRD